MRLTFVRFFGTTTRWCATAITFILMASSLSPAWALITGGEGNDPVHDPGWPTGASIVFNTNSRVAHWEGPPLGGGQSHAECRGDTAAFQLILDDFSKIDLPKKRLVLHDGIGRSFWLLVRTQCGLVES